MLVHLLWRYLKIYKVIIVFYILVTFTISRNFSLLLFLYKSVNYTDQFIFQKRENLIWSFPGLGIIGFCNEEKSY